MPPTVDLGIKHDYALPFFSVDLEGPDQFDPALFDQQLKEVSNERNPNFPIGSAKFIVLGARILVFAAEFQHAEMHRRASEASTYGGELVCAGQIDFNFVESGRSPINRAGVDLRSGERLISGYSYSLRETLCPNASDDFKLNSLKSKLGAFFKFK